MHLSALSVLVRRLTGRFAPLAEERRVRRAHHPVRSDHQLDSRHPRLRVRRRHFLRPLSLPLRYARPVAGTPQTSSEPVSG